MNQSLARLGTSMEVIQNKINILSNNVANSNTDYFKKEKLLEQSFQNVLSNTDVEEIVKTMQVNKRADVFITKPGVYVDEVFTVFEEGALVETDDTNYLALNGEGFFAVENEEAGRTEYVRGGRFRIDEEGYLTNNNGLYLLDNENNRIFAATNRYSIDSEGNISNAVGAVAIAQIVNFENLNALSKGDWGAYINNEEGNIIDSEAEVKQGYKESSNVDLTEEMIKLVELTRTFESQQKTIQTIDDINGKVSNELGKVY